MGKSTINVKFDSYVKLPEGNLIRKMNQVQYPHDIPIRSTKLHVKSPLKNTHEQLSVVPLYLLVKNGIPSSGIVMIPNISRVVEHPN
jgi:hypothetical protein